MDRSGGRCDELIQVTADTLSEGAVFTMFLALKHRNYEINITSAVRKSAPMIEEPPRHMKRLLGYFPLLAYALHDDDLLDLDDLTIRISI